MNILVTGSHGYIGTVLVRMLLDEGHTVSGLDTGFFAEGNLTGEPMRQYRTIRKDIRLIEPDDVAQFDAIIHLAELSNDPMGELDPAITMNINHEGTKHLIDLALQAGVERFLYSSSCSVYGASDGLSDESSPVNPLTAYARAKVKNEAYLISQKNRDFIPVVLRNATVYGPSPRMRFDLAVNNLAGVAYTNRVVQLTSDGEAWRPFVHIADVCRAFLAGLTADKHIVSGQIFNVGSTKSNYRIRDVADIISRIFSVKDITRDTSSKDSRNYRISFEKIKRMLPGYEAENTVDSGAIELLALFKKISLTRDVFESELYTRLKMLNKLKYNRTVNAELFYV